MMLSFEQLCSVPKLVQKIISVLHTYKFQALPLCYTSFTLNFWRNADASIIWLFCIKFWTNMWWCRWISWIWFCVIDLSEDPLLNKDLRYLVVLQLSFRNPLLQELLLTGTHYQTPSPRWLRYHPSEAICLLHHARTKLQLQLTTNRIKTIDECHYQWPWITFKGHFSYTIDNIGALARVVGDSWVFFFRF